MKKVIFNAMALLCLAVLSASCDTGKNPYVIDEREPESTSAPDVPAGNGAPTLEQLAHRVCGVVLSSDAPGLINTMHPEIMPYLLAAVDQDGNVTYPTPEQVEQAMPGVYRTIGEVFSDHPVQQCAPGPVSENIECPENIDKDLEEFGIPVEQCGSMTITFIMGKDEEVDGISAIKSEGTWYLSDMLFD